MCRTPRWHLNSWCVCVVQDTKIASLERNIRDLEDEIQILKANGLLNTEDREEEMKQMEVYKNHSKFMKTKVHTHIQEKTQTHTCTHTNTHTFTVCMMCQTQSLTISVLLCRFKVNRTEQS